MAPNFFRKYCWVLLLIGCKENYAETKLENRPFILNSSPTFKGYYYKGSDSVFDYFESRWYFTENKFFKIKKGVYKIKEEFPLTSKKERRIDVFRTPEIFAVSLKDTLYIPKKL